MEFDYKLQVNSVTIKLAGQITPHVPVLAARLSRQ